MITESILQSKLSEHFEIILLDTTDRRSIANIGKFDLQNVLLAIKHGILFLWLLSSKRPDIVYTQIARNFFAYLRDCLYLVPSRLFNKKVVVHLHGSDLNQFYMGSSFIMRYLIRWSLNRAKRAIVLGNNLQSQFWGLVNENRIVVLPNGIKPLFPHDDRSKSSFSSSNGQIKVLYLGALIKRKGFMDVLQSVPAVIKKLPQVRYVLVGEFTYKEEMHEASKFINDNKINDYVAMPGPLTGLDKVNLLKESDIFVFPPIAPEGQPLVILEAMSAGLPIIATPNGAITETVSNGVNGYLVPPSDPATIAKKILLLCHDESLRCRMGRESYRLFIERFTFDRWIDNLAHIFQEVLSE